MRALTDHPASVGQTYAEHLRFAVRFGASMVVGGVACIIHGVLPFCLTSSGSRRVRALADVLARDPARRKAEAPDGFNWSI